MESSQHGAHDHLFVQQAQLLRNYALGDRQVVEGDLGEKVMFGLVLHASHDCQPEEPLIRIVPAGYDLVFDKIIFDLIVIPSLSLMVPKKQVG